ncbi:hypothetical protein FJT64_007374 [Amphibalanus amphitrite]|uniref:Uncharacterized protein n=1 Tax=Amphibalanus amphitrite TaxID=1232801 RepID=A0A6A4VW63_AMPAM|nr:hypothetical protein FJT64_007374 [Amphibalanus amphitrite]
MTGKDADIPLDAAAADVPPDAPAVSRGVEEQTEEDTEVIEELPAPPSPMAGEYGGWAEYDGPPLTGPGDCLPPPATEGDDSDEWAPPQSSGEGSSDRSSVRSLPDPFADESYMDAENDEAEEEEFADQALQQAARMRLMHKMELDPTYKPPQPRQRSRWRCPVEGCTVAVINLPAQLDRHFESRSCPQFQEAYDAATQVEEPAAKDRRPAPNGVAILERFAAYLRGVLGGCRPEQVVQRPAAASSGKFY